LQPEFVELMPPDLQSGILYISMEYATAIHLCVCGCGNRVITPFSPTDWRLIFDGETVSLHPSIGSWSLPCQSHYWIRNNEIVMAPKWSEKQIKQGRDDDFRNKQGFFKGTRKERKAKRKSKKTGE
jgi:hypothetical protein